MKTKPFTTCHRRSATNFTPRIIAIAALAGLLLCALTRSHGQPADKATVNPAGTYSLISVDGKAVPCTINHEGTDMNIHSGTFTITTNDQITSVMNISVGEQKDIRIERHATYTQNGAELTMKWQSFGMTKGRVAGQTFIMTNEGMAYIYQK